MITATLTREQVAARFQCSHAELGRLLRERIAPLPVRVEGAILWFEDECANEATVRSIAGLLKRRRQRAVH
jgi:hypothetical protein